MNLLLVYLFQQKLNKLFNSLLFLVATILFSCTSKESKFEDGLLLVSNKLMNYEYVIIIPNEGCGSCISNTTTYVIENFDEITLKTAVVFTDIKDYKVLNLKVNSKILRNENVFIDSTNILRSVETSSIYPQLVIIENKKVKTFKIFNESLLKLD